MVKLKRKTAILNIAVTSKNVTASKCCKELHLPYARNCIYRDVLKQHAIKFCAELEI
jgi:hypothetical protein